MKTPVKLLLPLICTAMMVGCTYNEVPNAEVSLPSASMAISSRVELFEGKSLDMNYFVSAKY